ncbi:uncharacterized protein N0V89_004027 [Didymosphaeria variabile]|uniref:Zn(2)-C6 fungal-type domain-containing protein n=1 Tax=Didymosphaeria variabile TaxID=1932322 RepID=A0A9W8XR15_9PLEO|nr:uncharacterized protein N0V89_004027 [Didymosphaeria variabile]KAJ4356001.1 hypothetical protein N0V89_004027 [Didymosphaeria variabile]
MAVGVDRRAKTVAAKLDHALLLQPVGNAMSYDPLAQSSGAGFPVPETTTSGIVDERSDYYSAQTDQAGAETSPQQQLLKKRRASKDKTAVIRRSSSTPHMRNLALGTSSELSPTGDKRRNKLGYHRTSVACGHCRRRKIRCLVANDEVTGRCANCIRLKKECNFYPVDQAPEQSRSQAGAPKEASIVAPTSSNTSSPRHPVSVLGGKVDEFRPPFPGTLSTNSVSRYEVHSESDSEPHHMTPTSGMPVQQPGYGYPQPIDTQWPPSTGFLPSSSVSESPSSSTGYWRPSPTTANSAFGSESNVSGVHTPATTMSYGSHQDNQNWAPPNFQPPSRSMSYGNIEGLPQHYQNQPLGVAPHEYRRTAPYPFPTTIDTSPAAIHSNTIGPHSSAPLSAPIVSGNAYNYPPPWNPYQGSQNPGHEGPVQSRAIGGHWYTEPGHLGQVQEEGAPPMAYGHQGMSHF